MSFVYEGPLTTIHNTIALILLKYPKFPTIYHKPNLYTSQYMPGISLINYIERISTYFFLTNEGLICSLIYMDRFVVNTKMELTSHEIHRMVLIANSVTMKFHYDEFFTNEYYANIGGIELEEFNMLEKDFLQGINYELYINTKTYERYKAAINGYKL